MPDNSFRHKHDTHYKKAKKQGYRSRSAYKLIGIQQRFNIFKRAYYILDIGSHPGSWLQVAKKQAEQNLKKYRDDHYHRDHFKLMGVDLKRVAPIDDVETYKMDATDPKLQDIIDDYFGGKKLDLIISDASIKKTGNKIHDQISQIRLGRKILNIAINNLKYKGNFVLKCFQGDDFKSFYDEAKRHFRFFQSYKPKASKKQSNETFLVGMTKK